MFQVFEMFQVFLFLFFLNPPFSRSSARRVQAGPMGMIIFFLWECHSLKQPIHEMSRKRKARNANDQPAVLFMVVMSRNSMTQIPNQQLGTQVLVLSVTGSLGQSAPGD